MQCLYILLTPESVQYCVGFFSALPIFHRTVREREEERKKEIEAYRPTVRYMKGCGNKILEISNQIASKNWKNYSETKGITIVKGKSAARKIYDRERE